MFLRATKRFKDGKVHHYWSMVENVRVGRSVFRIARGEAEPSKTVASVVETYFASITLTLAESVLRIVVK